MAALELLNLCGEGVKNSAVRVYFQSGISTVRGCNGIAEQISKKVGGKFWKCNTCGNTFSDDNGKPVVKFQKRGSKK